MIKSNRLIKSVIIFIGTLICNSAIAEVYKCTSFDAQSNKQSIVYTDKPCSEQVKQTLIDVQTSPTNNATIADESPLDLKITRAVLMEDFKLAKSLAKTKEHWRLISMAEGAQQTSVKTIPIADRQIAIQDECAIARNAYESTARARWRDEDLIATKKNSMYAACGVAESAGQNSVVVVGNRFGGIQSSRWIGTPYGPILHNQPYNKSYRRYQSNNVNNGSDLSIQYQGSRFGVRSQSGGIQQHTDIRQQFRRDNFTSPQRQNIRQQFR
jgi:hypothetical protein